MNFFDCILYRHVARRKKQFFIIFALLCVAFLSKSALAQTQISQRSANSSKQTARDNWWSAQRGIETAIAELEAFIKNAAVSDKRLETAKLQLGALKELRAQAASPVWTKMTALGELTWRVALVEPQSEATHFVIEVRNNSERRSCFAPFDKFPLALTDNKGQSNPMLSSSSAPKGVSIEMDPFSTPRGAERWCLQPRQVIATEVNFAPLDKGVVSGQINYREGALASEAAKFSLIQTKIQ